MHVPDRASIVLCKLEVKSHEAQLTGRHKTQTTTHFNPDNYQPIFYGNTGVHEPHNNEWAGMALHATDNQQFITSLAVQ